MNILVILETVTGKNFFRIKKWLLNSDNAEIQINQAKSHSNMTVMNKQATVKTEGKS